MWVIIKPTECFSVLSMHTPWSYEHRPLFVNDHSCSAPTYSYKPEICKTNDMKLILFLETSEWPMLFLTKMPYVAIVTFFWKSTKLIFSLKICNDTALWFWHKLSKIDKAGFRNLRCWNANKKNDFSDI